MNQRKFKTLMLYGEFIDPNLLEKGIYYSNKPFLYSESQTIENIIQETRDVIKATGMTAFTENYFDNLKQCILVDVEIIIKSSTKLHTK